MAALFITVPPEGTIATITWTSEFGEDSVEIESGRDSNRGNKFEEVFGKGEQYQRIVLRDK